MKTFFRPSAIVFVLLFAFSGCDTIKNLPTNTTGGLFSLNGTWQLNATTDNKSLEGSTITVYPVVGNGTLKSIQNNTYCVKEGVQLWRNVKDNSAGGFNLETLVSACNGSTITRDATLTVINKDEVTLTSRTATGTELIQQWKRVTNQ